MATLSEFKHAQKVLGEKSEALSFAWDAENAANRVFIAASKDRREAEISLQTAEETYYKLLADLKDNGFELENPDSPWTPPVPLTEEILIAEFQKAKGKLMATIEQVLTEVQETNTVVDSVVTFIASHRAELADLRAQLVAAQQDPAKLDQIISDLDANQAKLATAIATTPENPNPAPPVVETPEPLPPV